MPSASDNLLAELDPTTQGDIIMRKYRSMPWPVLRTTDFRPTSPNFGQSLSSTTVDAPKPKQLTFSDETTFRPISPIRRSPQSSPTRRSASPSRIDSSLSRPSSSYRPNKHTLSPSRSINTGRLSPSRNQTSPGRLSPEVSAISQRIFQSIDEIRKEIQLSSDEAKTGRYKHRAERDGSPSKYRDTSPPPPRSIRAISPSTTFKSEASPSTRAFRQDLSLATSRNPRRQPRAEISRIVADVPELGNSRRRVEFSDSPSKRATSPVGLDGSSNRPSPTIASGLAVKAKPRISDPDNTIDDLIEGLADFVIYNCFHTCWLYFYNCGCIMNRLIKSNLMDSRSVNQTAIFGVMLKF